MSRLEESRDSSPEGRKDEVTHLPGPWLAAIFDLEDMYSDIPGWLPQEVITLPGVESEQIEPVTWNGWDCPHFEEAGADLIVNQHNRWTQQRASQAGQAYATDLLARYDPESDSYWFFAVDGYDVTTGRHTGEWETFSGTAVEVEPGYTLHLYPVGAWSWTWERSDSPA